VALALRADLAGQHQHQVNLALSVQMVSLATLVQTSFAPVVSKVSCLRPRLAKQAAPVVLMDNLPQVRVAVSAFLAPLCQDHLTTPM
jgi:hypothetical protein